MVADSYSVDGIGVILMGTGNDNNTWGTNCNSSVFQIIMDALANVLTSAVTGGTLNLSGSPPPAGASQTRYAALKFTGILSSNQLVQVPNLNKWWLVCNATSGAFTLKFKTTSGSASTAIPQNSGWQMVRCDGSDVIEVWPFNTNQIQMPDGTAALPPHSFLTDPTSGFYMIGTGNVGFSIGGTKRWDYSTTGSTLTGTLSVSGDVTITNGNLSVQNTGTSSVVEAFKNAIPAVDDIIAGYDFYSKDSAGNKQKYGAIYTQVKDPTSTSEDSWMYIDIFIAGVQSNRMLIGDTTVSFTGGIFTSATVTAGAFAGGTFSGTTIAGSAITASGALSGATAAGAMVATQAEQETGSATDKLVTPGRQQFHPSAAKFWGNITVSGGVPSLNSPSYNITSITDTAPGRLTVTIGTDFSSSNWSGFVDVHLNNVILRVAGISVSTQAAGSVEYGCVNGTPAYVDPDAWNVGGWGDQ